MKASLPVLALVVGLAASVVAFEFAVRQVEMSEAMRFEARAEKVAQTLLEGLEIFEYGLYGARGLFLASKSVERDEFRRMVASRHILREFPGALGLGYIDRVRPESLATYLQQTRADGAPGFNLRFLQPTEGELYVIRFIEPDSINHAAQGLVINSERYRREAADHAMRSGKPTLTAPISLVQADKKFTGFLYLLPEYGPGPEPVDSDERVRRLRGWTYFPLVMEPLIEKHMGRIGDHLWLQITDVENPKDPKILFRSPGNPDPVTKTWGRPVTYDYATERKLGERDLHLEIHSQGHLQNPGVLWVPRLILIGGIFASILTSLLLASWARVQLKAETMAEKMTADIRRARDEAEHANHAKSRFLAVMSHEIRTPMNGVMGMAQLLHGTRLEAEQSEYVRTIQSSAESLLEIINDILDFSKIEAGKLELNTRPFDLRELCEDILDLLFHRANPKGVELVLQAPAHLPLWYFADDLRIRQIITNLVSNAIKFTHQGRVILALHETEFVGGTVLQIQVKDTGIGLSGEAIGRLFQEFNQADSTTTRRYGGTGLGLAICKRLCQMMGGDIGVESQLGSGSVFTARLPLEKVPGKRSPEPLPLPKVTWGLCVPDPALRESLLGALKLNPSHVTHLTGRKAIEAFALAKGHQDIGCIIDVDAYREDASGPEALDRGHIPFLRFRHLISLFDAKTPLLFLSVSAKPAELAELTSRPIDWIQKPIRHRQLNRACTVLCHGGPPLTVTPAATPPEAPMKDRPVSDWKPATKPCRILLAEDNAVNRMVALKMLSKMNCEVETAETGLAAVNLASQKRYDLIFMDCEMPEMDGYEATRQLRASQGPNGETPILAFTANAMASDRERCLEAGMNDVVTKPIREQALSAAVTTWFRKPEADIFV